MNFLILMIMVTLLCPNNGLSENESSEEVCSPDINDFDCGVPWKLAVNSAKVSTIELEVSPYFLNKTADKLSAEGFRIFDQIVEDDLLFGFSYSNVSYTSNFNMTYIPGPLPVGGKPASVIRSFYMAQIGEKMNDNITWLCDGVVINREWVLTAAHCFTFPNVNPNLIRLGEYNLSVPADEIGLDRWGKYIEDYPIEDVILHPEFEFGERYHDLALLKLPRKTPSFASNISPICLPFDWHSKNNLVDSEVVLTGWGAQSYGGGKLNVLHEVDLKVFNASVCSNAYSKLRDTRIKYPLGLTEENILCVGWEEDGKDACKGDSGAPVTYQEGGSFYGHFFLAGIVSGGYGCGQKEFPGLYIPINQPKYLRWIRETAFQEYISQEKEEVCKPSNFYCSQLPLHTRSVGHLHNGSVVPLNYLNKTAEKLSSEGFIITDINVRYDGYILKFAFYNETHRESIGFKDIGRIPIDFVYRRSLYMAQIGRKIGDGFSWKCEGVRIKTQWVLTAANCFTYLNESLNLVRLGEYDKSKTVPEIWEDKRLISEYSIEKIFIYPEFKEGQVHHNLALLKISRGFPDYLETLTVICLPWGYGSNINQVEKNVTLLGWGLTNFRKPKSDVLQGVDIKVLNTSVCSRAYDSILNSSFPYGMLDEDILCGGWAEDGINVYSQWKTGAPLVYSGKYNADYLAGIFSYSDRYALKEVPGIYIPVNKPKYLRWIRKIAFQ